MEIFLNILKFFAGMNNIFFSKTDGLISLLPLPYWAIDGIQDSVHMLPFLFLIFVFIEIVEFYFSDKMNSIVKCSKNAGPLLGSALASIPQCGFSVIAATLYTKKFITRGTLIAVFIATSDEAIPVLLTQPESLPLIVKIISIKLLIAIVAGYFTDILPTGRVLDDSGAAPVEDSGCCKHHLSKPRKTELVLHPIGHTLNVFVFILAVTLIINYLMTFAGAQEEAGFILLQNSPLQPVLTAIFGLIPNCAVSVALTLMFLKGVISFGSVISGLCSGAGLGLLVLFKRNESLKDTFKVLSFLLGFSILAGILIQTFCK